MNVMREGWVGQFITEDGKTLVCVKNGVLKVSRNFRSTKTELTSEFHAELIENGTYVNGRITATRLATIGVFALAAKKGRKDTRTTHVVVTGSGFYASYSVKSTHANKSAKFVQKFNAYTASLPAVEASWPAGWYDNNGVTTYYDGESWTAQTR